MSTAVLDAPQLQDTDGNERDRMKHYVRHGDLERAMLDGVPAVALCGKKWLPTHDPSRYPMCKTCLNIYNTLPGD